MSKKFIPACLAVAALIALPASASAARLCETEPDHTTCNSVAVGTKFDATSVGSPEAVDASGNTLWTCSTATMTGSVTKNSEGIVEATITTATSWGTGPTTNMPECTGAFGNFTVTANGGTVDGENLANGTPWCMKASGAEDRFFLRGNACNLASRSIAFRLDSTTVGECNYSRSITVEGTYTTDIEGTQDAILTEPRGPRPNSPKRKAASSARPSTG